MTGWNFNWSVLLGAAILAGACGSSGDVEVTANASGGDRWDLASVVAGCENGASDGQPGIVEIATELRDANTVAKFTKPCIIHLVGDANVTLNNVTITSGVLNVHDRGDNASGRNIVDLQNSTITAGGPDDGILVELNDAGDVLRMEATQLTAPAGIVLRVAGTRNDTNDGGTIRLIKSRLLSDGPGTEGIQVLASEHSGAVHLVETVVDTPGALTVLADTCDSVRERKRLDCSAEQVARELEQ